MGFDVVGSFLCESSQGVGWEFSFLPCVGDDYGWFFLGFCGSRYQGGCCDFLLWVCFR